MNAVDTNVVVRVLLRDDPVQAEIADAFVAGGAWISHLVLIETIWVVRKQRDHAATVGAVDMLLEHEHFVIQESRVVAEALNLYRDRPAVSFSDCLILATARQAGHLPLATFDFALSRLPGTARLGR
ncbi:MAG TPA: type II toxin-antitoxin system VapC family toxin [Thermoanaerobaculia bacterium]|nr:type II toxin-antitoxin system VapC family toxin [Thermoanaerobaculia bacterium]